MMTFALSRPFAVSRCERKIAHYLSSGTVFIWRVLPLRTPAVLPPRFRLASPKRNQTCGGPGGLGGGGQGLGRTYGSST